MPFLGGTELCFLRDGAPPDERYLLVADGHGPYGRNEANEQKGHPWLRPEMLAWQWCVAQLLLQSLTHPLLLPSPVPPLSSRSTLSHSLSVTACISLCLQRTSPVKESIPTFFYSFSSSVCTFVGSVIFLFLLPDVFPLFLSLLFFLLSFPWRPFMNPSPGGYSGNIGHDPHLLYTLSAVQILGKLPQEEIELADYEFIPPLFLLLLFLFLFLVFLSLPLPICMFIYFEE